MGAFSHLIPPTTPLPNECVILSVFPRETSGYAIMVSLEEKATVYSGVAHEAQEVGVLTEAWRIAKDNKQPLVVVTESMKTGDRRLDRRAKALKTLGHGRAWERWSEGMSKLNVPKRRLHVAKITWRDLFFDGQPEGDAVANVKRIYGENVVGAVGALTRHEEAMAIGLATWARHAWDVYHKVRDTGARYP